MKSARTMPATSLVGRSAIAVLLLFAGTAAQPSYAQLPLLRASNVTLDLSGATFRQDEIIADQAADAPPEIDLDGPDGRAPIEAFDRLAGGRILFTAGASIQLPGGLEAHPEDVVERSSTLGDTLRFDGSAQGLPAGTHIDAVYEAPNGDLVLSFSRSVDFQGLRVRDEDLVGFDGANGYSVLEGTVQGLDPSLDLDAADWVAPGLIAASFDSAGQLDGLSFDDEDVLLLSVAGAPPRLLSDASNLDPAWASADLQAVAVPEAGAGGLWIAGAALLCFAGRRGRRSDPTLRRGGPAAPRHVAPA